MFRKRRRTEVFCLKCAEKEIDKGKLAFYEAYKMRPVYYTYKHRRILFGYVCPNCGHIFRVGMPPIVEKRHIIEVEKAVVSEIEKIIIPTVKTYNIDEIYEKMYRKVRKLLERTCSNNYHIHSA
jgi:hypothetical protein